MNEGLFQLGLFLLLMVFGYAFGSFAERRHYASIRRREAELQELVVVASKFIPSEDMHSAETRLVTGSVVISIDYFKRFVAGLRSLVGGRVSSYESLIDRARREAILRMKEEARQQGAHAVFNIKLETASIYKGRRQQVGSVEVLAYGTAVLRR